MNKYILLIFFFLLPLHLYAEKQTIKAVGIPLADHYAAIVAYEKYKDKMQYADYQLQILPGPDLVRRHFRSYSDTDVAYIVSPMVMDMYAKKPDFKWVSLVHRDGNAFIINKSFEYFIHSKQETSELALGKAFKRYKQKHSKPIEVALPSLLATHSTIFYKYLKDNGLKMALESDQKDIRVRIVKPPRSVPFLKTKDIKKVPAAFEQSLPWPQILESQNKGKIVWYSKDILKHPKGHVECIMIAKDATIQNKTEALREVIYYVHKAGIDIENAIQNKGDELQKIIEMIQEHIPSHSSEAIKQSLDSDIKAINFANLNVDANAKDSFKEIMDLAYEAGFIAKKISIETLATDQFSTKITEKE